MIDGCESHMGSWNWTQDFWRSSQCSYLLNCLFSPKEYFFVWNPVLTTEEETIPAVSSCVVCTNMFLSIYFHCLMIFSKCSQNLGVLLGKIGGYSLCYGLNLHQPYLGTQKNLPWLHISLSIMLVLVGTSFCSSILILRDHVEMALLSQTTAVLTFRNIFLSPFFWLVTWY